MSANDQPRLFDVVLFGATGYTGQLCAEYIANHTKLPGDLRWAIAGRSKNKLENVLDTLHSKDDTRAPPAIEVCDLEYGQLRALALKARIVISTVGPYQNYGEPLFRACAETGTHYLDCTGETPWIHDMIKKYHETARQTGAIMIPSCGFDSVPADISAFAVAEYIRTKFSSRTARVDYTIHQFKANASGGTVGSALNVFEQYPIRELLKLMAPFSLSPRKPSRSKPQEGSSLAAIIFGLRHVPRLGWMGLSPQGSVDRCYVNRSWALAADNDETTYGENFDFQAWVTQPGPIRAMLWHYTILSGMLLFCISPIRWLFKKVWFQPGHGPAASFRKKCFFECRSNAIADNPQGQQVTSRLRFEGDPYLFTGLCLAEAALLLSKDDSIQTRLQGGVLTSALLGDDFVQGLKENGLQIEVKEGADWENEHAKRR